MTRSSHSINDPAIAHIINGAIEARGGMKQSSPDGVIEGLEAFISAVNWYQPFFYSLLIYYCFLLLMTIFIRHHSTPQFILLSLCLISVLSSSLINKYCFYHWENFDLDQNYFDDSGVFISAIWSTPISIIGLINVIFLLIDTSSLLITVKKKELAIKREKTKKSSTNETDNKNSNNSNNLLRNRGSKKETVENQNTKITENNKKFILD